MLGNLDYENMTPEECTAAKNKEASRVAAAKLQNIAKIEVAKNSFEAGLSDEVIAQITGLSLEKVMELRKEDF